jgi:hypothetical protein
MDRQTLRDRPHCRTEGGPGLVNRPLRRRAPMRVAAPRRIGDDCRGGAGPQDERGRSLAAPRPLWRGGTALRASGRGADDALDSSPARRCKAAGAPASSAERSGSPGTIAESLAEPAPAALPDAAKGNPLAVWVQGEALVGRQGTLARLRARRGTRAAGAEARPLYPGLPSSAPSVPPVRPAPRASCPAQTRTRGAPSPPGSVDTSRPARAPTSSPTAPTGTEPRTSSCRRPSHGRRACLAARSCTRSRPSAVPPPEPPRKPPLRLGPWASGWQIGSRPGLGTSGAPWPVLPRPRHRRGSAGRGRSAPDCAGLARNSACRRKEWSLHRLLPRTLRGSIGQTLPALRFRPVSQTALGTTDNGLRCKSFRHPIAARPARRNRASRGQTAASNESGNTFTSW